MCGHNVVVRSRFGQATHANVTIADVALTSAAWLIQSCVGTAVSRTITLTGCFRGRRWREHASNLPSWCQASSGHGAALAAALTVLGGASLRLEDPLRDNGQQHWSASMSSVRKSCLASVTSSGGTIARPNCSETGWISAGRLPCALWQAKKWYLPGLTSS